jgi:hypothetical protein
MLNGISCLTHSCSAEINVLYFGIIDILQDYDISKKLEHAYKSFQVDPTSISAVDLNLYSKRFGISHEELVRLHDSLQPPKLPSQPFNLIEHVDTSPSPVCTTEHHKGKDHRAAKDPRDSSHRTESSVNDAAKERRSSPFADRYTHKERFDEDYVNTQSHNIMADYVY